MSNTVNDTLIERAREQQSYWESTVWDRIIQRDLDANDLEALRYHVAQAEKEMAMQEDHPGNGSFPPVMDEASDVF